MHIHFNGSFAYKNLNKKMFLIKTSVQKSKCNLYRLIEKELNQRALILNEIEKIKIKIKTVHSLCARLM